MQGIAGTITAPAPRRAPLHTVAVTAPRQVIVTVILTDNDTAPVPSGLRQDLARGLVLSALQADHVVRGTDNEPGRYEISGITASALG